MSEDVLDLNEFLERVQGDKELLLELLDIFEQDYEVKVEKLREAIKDNNFEEIKSIAHSLKGASGNISAKTLRSVLLNIEEMGKNGDLTGIEDTIAKLDSSYQLLHDRMAAIKEEMK